MHLPDQPGSGARDCKDGRVEGANHFTFSAGHSVREELQREEVVAAGRFGGYLAKLLDNKQVVRVLKQRQPEVLAELEPIAQTVSLEQ